MSGQKDSNSGDEYMILILIAIAIMTFWFLMVRYETFALLVWKSIRSLELIITLNFPTVYNLWTTPMRWGDETFSHFNSIFGWTYRLIIGVPMIMIAYSASINKQKSFNINDYVITIWRRFFWLKIVADAQPDNQIIMYKPIKNKLSPFKKLPVKINMKKSYIKFNTLDFPDGMEPLDYLEKYQDNLNEKLTEQLGHMLKIENGKIQWKDKDIERFVKQILQHIPAIVLKEGEPNARVLAWQKCLRIHRYERTFAMGILYEARLFGVVEPANFLWIRHKAIDDLKKNNYSTFTLWRALLAAGGRCAYPEGAGVFCHFQYEKALDKWAQKNPEDQSVVHTLKGTPWVLNATSSFYEVRDIELNLRKK